jgi:hypothetical protein
MLMDSNPQTFRSASRSDIIHSLTFAPPTASCGLAMATYGRSHLPGPPFRRTHQVGHPRTDQLDPVLRGTWTRQRRVACPRFVRGKQRNSTTGATYRGRVALGTTVFLGIAFGSTDPRIQLLKLNTGVRFPSPLHRMIRESGPTHSGKCLHSDSNSRTFVASRSSPRIRPQSVEAGLPGQRLSVSRWFGRATSSPSSGVTPQVRVQAGGPRPRAVSRRA